MNAEEGRDVAVSKIAAAIGDPSRSRMLHCLMDGHARTGTELAIVADVSPSTASTHLSHLKEEHLVKAQRQGKHRYYSLAGRNVAVVLETLNVLAGSDCDRFVSRTPSRLAAARTCYDHMAGAAGVAIHDRFKVLRWITTDSTGGDDTYNLSREGEKACDGLGIDVTAMRSQRRRFAYACLDWSERRPHIGGALGAALLIVAVKSSWVIRDLDSRAIEITIYGRREMQRRFGLEL